MPKEEEREYLKILGVDKYSTDKDEFEIKRAYKRLALQFHPDKNQNDFSARKQFDEISKAFEFLTLDYRNDSHRQDYDQVFFDFLRDIFDWKQDAEGASTNNFLMYFCGSKQHPCSSDMDFDSRYQDTEEEEDIDGESELDSIMEIIKNRKKKGKPVPEEFKEENLLDMKTKLNQHKEDMKRDASKKQSSKKGKTPVPVAKPKPKSKKQLQAEQRRREKEMEKIAMELEEKRKEEEEKEKQRKQLEVEKQKRLEEERIKAQNEERKRREKEQKEREKQQKLEQEKEEKRRRQQEEEKKRREEEEKRRKAEKEKADKEKAAKKAAQQAAKEKEDKEKAANKNQNMKRQQQQQRTDQQQYPREIPPRFQRKMKQQQQQQAQFQAPPQPLPQSLPQQPKIQPKPAPPVGKKKDPNRFGPKEFADAIEPVEDSGWAQSAPGKGSGWGNSLETWEESDKWGTEDRQWGDKEGTWERPVVEGGDKDTWPAVGSKGAIGDKLKTSSSEAGSEKGQYSANSSPKTSVSSMSAALKSDNSAQGNVTSNVDKKSLPSNNWQGAYPAPTENWDVIDESIDQAIDAADAATAKDNAGLAAGWGGVAKGGLGGLIGNSSNWELKDSSSSVHSQESGKCELANNSSVSEAPSWSKTPGKGFKPKLPTTSTAVTSNITTSWGGTPAETNTKWTEPNSSSEGVTNSKPNKPPLLDSTSIAKSAAENKSEPSVTPNSSTKLSASGWGEAPASNPSNWGNSADITGAACWDSVMSKSDSSELKAASNSKVSQWLESTGMSLADFEWGQENVEHEEGSEGSLDGWTTASKRNRAPKPANDSNAWMNRSLKQLLDMGFKQEDAEKALKANHMNIESAIGDLLAMNISENMEQTVAVPGGKLQEPDPAEAARIQQQQQQSQSKLNRKQRRKLQQQQQQQAEQNTLASRTDPKQGQTDLVASKPMTQTGDVISKPDNEQQNTTLDQYASKTDETQDSNSNPTAPATKSDKPPLSVAGPSKPSNGQAQVSGNGKRAGPPLIPPAPGPGVQGPLRPPLAHPLLHPQLVQQFHLQQLRMAQGGLLQPPFTPQQFAMLQQIAQLQLVQQRLAAQSVAQQHMGQKQQVVPQQQLYQQQQQIALMIAQMQQQVLQQQPSLAGRHPALPFTAVQQQQQQSLAQQQQQQSPTAQQKGNKPATNDKPTSESAQNKTTDTVKSQSNEPSTVPTATTEEQTKQPSPVPQSRLTQWKQPLLQDSSSVTQPSVTSSISNPVDSNPQTVSTSSQSTSSMLSSVVSAPSISTNDVSDPSAPGSNNVSPRTRIPDPVSSRWGVDAGPKLSADPPEFKPGVPWRPAPRNDKRDDGRDVSPGTVEVSSRSSSSSSDSPTDSWSNPGNQPVTAPSSVPPVNTGKVADDAVSTTANSGFSGLSINNSTFESGPIDFGRSSTPWQSAESKAPPQLPQGTTKLAPSAASLLRPPPGLGTEKSLPESPLFDDEPPAWLKSLIDGSSLAGDKTQPEFQFSRFGFANNPAPWSPRDASPQPFSPLTPNPQPWAAVGGPAPTLSSSGSAVSMATSEIVRSGSVGAAEPPNLQNSGIIWSTNQPIASAEEKLPGTLPGASVPAVSPASGVAPSRNTVNSMSTWLVLRNLSPRMDHKTLRPLCERHGPLLTFQLNLRHGNSLIRYGSMEEAAKARAALNGLMLSGTQVVADFATDSDIGSFFEQTMDWSANPFPSNTYGNQWSFQNVLGSAATSDSIQSAAKVPTAKNQPPVTTTEQPVPKINHQAPGMQWGAAVGALPSQGLAHGEQSKMNPTTPQWGTGSQSSEQPGPKSTTGTPGMPWGSAPGATPVPSYLWGSGPSQQPALGGNFSQVPSMWSFPAGVPRDVEPQSGSGDGLVSPSMTTFLPPGLLNGGGDPV